MVRFQKSPTNVCAAIFLAGALLTGCGGGESSSSGSAATGTGTTGAVTDTTGTNTNLQSNTLGISGTPATTVATGSPYTFTPTASGASAAVAYSISNKPAWASFDTTTGKLSGTPSDADLGDFNAIVISANSGTQSASLAAFRISVAAAVKTGTAQLSWTAPTQNTDGTSVANLGGYNIYFGASSTAMTNKIQVSNAGLTNYTVTGLDAGTHFFGITAYTTNGVESELSAVGSTTIM